MRRRKKIDKRDLYILLKLPIYHGVGYVDEGETLRDIFQSDPLFLEEHRSMIIYRLEKMEGLGYTASHSNYYTGWKRRWFVTKKGTDLLKKYKIKYWKSPPYWP